MNNGDIGNEGQEIRKNWPPEVMVKISWSSESKVSSTGYPLQ